MEMEVKVRLPEDMSLNDVLLKLSRLGYSLIDEREEHDIYIDLTSCPNVGRDVAVRLRLTYRKGRLVGGELTYKGPRLDRDVKLREEIAVGINDPLKLALIVSRLGFNTFKVVKSRWILADGEGLKVFLDDVKGLGRFIELELISPKSKRHFLDKVRGILKALELEGSKLITRSYLEMLLGVTEDAEV